MSRPRPGLLDIPEADAARLGLDEERNWLARLDQDTPRAYVIDRMRKWEAEIHRSRLVIERMQGRLEANNKWLTEHPEEL